MPDLLKENGFSISHEVDRCERCAIAPSIQFRTRVGERADLVLVCTTCLAEALAKLPPARLFEFENQLAGFKAEKPRA